jgi:hypothetical protein
MIVARKSLAAILLSNLVIKSDDRHTVFAHLQLFLVACLSVTRQSRDDISLAKDFGNCCWRLVQRGTIRILIPAAPVWHISRIFSHKFAQG